MDSAMETDIQVSMVLIVGQSWDASKSMQINSSFNRETDVEND